MRTAFLVAPDPCDAGRHMLACAKNNLAAFPPSLAFRIGTAESGTACIDWPGPVDLTADELVQTRQRRGEAVHRAVRFLQEHLQSGWVAREALVQEAAAAGITFRTLERAKAELGILSRQCREQRRIVWYWRLPTR